MGKKIDLYLINNKRGGVDQFVKSVLAEDVEYAVINSSHAPFVETYINSISLFKVYQISDIFRSDSEKLENLMRKFGTVLNIATLGVLEFLSAIIQSLVLLKECPSTNPLVVVLGGYPGALFGRVHAWIASSWFDRNVYLSIHNLRSPSSTWFKVIDQFLHVMLIRYVKAWIFVSESTRQSLSLPDECRSYVIHNGYSLAYSASFNVPKTHKKKVIGLIGTFEDRKGFDLLIDAYASLKKDLSFNRIYIFGEGTKKETQKLKSKVKACGLFSEVFFKGYVSDKQRIYDSLDLVVVPSRAYESFGYIQLESLLYGVPVIVSDHGGLKEVADIIRNRNIFTSNSVESLKKALIQLDENYEKELERVPFLASEVLRSFDLNDCVQRYAKILH